MTVTVTTSIDEKVLVHYYRKKNIHHQQRTIQYCLRCGEKLPFRRERGRKVKIIRGMICVNCVNNDIEKAKADLTDDRPLVDAPPLNPNPLHTWSSDQLQPHKRRRAVRLD